MTNEGATPVTDDPILINGTEQVPDGPSAAQPEPEYVEPIKTPATPDDVPAAGDGSDPADAK